MTTYIPPNLQDDKAQHVVPFILSLVAEHRKHSNAPFFIGLSALQGAGKSVLVTLLHRALTSPPHNLPTTIFSLDDLYLTHEDQKQLASRHPDNPLLQHRGQPSTHDIPLALHTFASLKDNKPTHIPQYEKSAYNGQGDRVPSSQWKEINTSPDNTAQVILFEGWSVGFRPLSTEELVQKHSEAVKAKETQPDNYRGRLGYNTLESVTTINNALKDYEKLWSYFNAFVHIDAEDPLYVYSWREEQEVGLRKSRGSGMTQEEVKTFVDGYFPAYELYADTLREGVFRPSGSGNAEAVSGGSQSTDETWRGKQLRLVVGKDRKVTKIEKI